MPKKTINFDVYRLHIKNYTEDPVKCEDLLLNCLEVYQPVYRSSGPVVLIDRIKQDGKYIFGTLAHNQMNDLPPYLDSFSGDTGQLPLKDSQGLAHYTSFMFDKELQFLIFESKLNGVSLKSFCNFLEINYSLPSIETEVVIDPIEIQKLGKMTIIKNFHVKIAKVTNGSIFASKKSSFNQIIKSADDTNNDTLEYRITAERGKGTSLRTNKIRQMALDLLKFKESKEVVKLMITGKETEEGEPTTINFVANRVRIQIQTERQRFSSDFALKEKYNLVAHAYEKIRKDLLLAYRLK